MRLGTEKRKGGAVRCSMFVLPRLSITKFLSTGHAGSPVETVESLCK